MRERQKITPSFSIPLLREMAAGECVFSENVIYFLCEEICSPGPKSSCFVGRGSHGGRFVFWPMGGAGVHRPVVWRAAAAYGEKALAFATPPYSSSADGASLEKRRRRILSHLFIAGAIVGDALAARGWYIAWA